LIGNRGQAEGFQNLEDLCRRADAQKLNRRTLEALVRAGALDKIGLNRATLMAQAPRAMRVAEQRSRDASSGQVDLFGAFVAGEAQNAIVEVPEWDDDQRLAGEKETLGLYLTGHPISRYEAELCKITKGRIGELVAGGTLDAVSGYVRREQQNVVLGGLIVGIRTKHTQSGRIAFLTLDDRSGRIEVSVYTEDYRRYGHLLTKDQVLVAEGSLGFDEYLGQPRLRSTRLMDIAEARARYAKNIEIKLKGAANGILDHLRAALAPFQDGPCPLHIEYINESVAARLRLGDRWRVSPTDELLRRLTALEGIEKVEVVYG
jgi:DNA polymerase-3 subunit alpha